MTTEQIIVAEFLGGSTIKGLAKRFSQGETYIENIIRSALVDARKPDPEYGWNTGDWN